ncbi:GtrA family protein [Pseudomonas sp. 22105]|jgi:putative flippase GtrA|uniref:Polysaccharide synthesis protein GtrA n=1 Tax=Pseudomonas glycinae TaxID=1785145 RepID=A0ABN4MX12_9PSED|nr:MULTISPECIES: GtrA family protein [Pseudomonas]AMQ86815.1 polysaccharide synthesis protein GtrA [Pseudomonas glycinae]AWA41238.1 polysaccharide synthesis protein GtrA [Pseudomonas fluorescens]NKF29788.1 polysaccharide synthesis protein GtrA [Pseudomonas sp. BG5]
MRILWKGFPAQTAIGLAATLVHWQIFFVLSSAVQLDQSASNFAAFCIAASFSFYMNALYTFETRTSVVAYLMFMSVMGVLSYGVGVFADSRNLPGLVTVSGFSLMNLLLGYCFFRFVLCRERQP